MSSAKIRIPFYAMCMSLGLLAFAITPARADIDALGLYELEFDANAVDDPAVDGDDAETIWDDCGRDGTPNAPATSCGNSIVSTGILDDLTGDYIFDGGMKDTQEPGHWSGKQQDGQPDKNDIRDAWASAYECTAEIAEDTGNCEEGDTVVYFGLDRYSHNGDANLGFWFFKSEVSFDPGTGDFSGNHQNGDVGVFAGFPQASNAVPEIVIVEWDNTCNKADDNTPGVGECAAANLRYLGIASGEGAVRCGSGSTNPDFCATTNDSTQESPWPYDPKEPDATSTFTYHFPYETYYEGGINLTALVGGACFASFMAETRSAQSFTATLKDFALGEFPLCGVDVVKTCRTSRVGNGYCSNDYATSCDPANTGSECGQDPTTDYCEEGSCFQDDETACAADADCTNYENYACDTSNPIFANGSDFVTQFDLAVTKKGPGTIYDLRVKEETLPNVEDIAAGFTAPCQVIAEDGTAVNPINLPKGTSVLLKDGAVPDAGVTYTIECKTSSNVALNQVTVTAGSADNLATPDLTDMFQFLAGPGACSTSPNPNVDIVKECQPGDLPITTIVTSGHLEFRIPYKITVTNTGNEDLTSVKVDDPTAFPNNVSGSLPNPQTIASLPANGSPHVFTGTYQVALPDQDGDGTPTVYESGCEIFFSNTAKVTDVVGAASGPISFGGTGEPPAPTSTDACPLCPNSCPR